MKKKKETEGRFRGLESSALYKKFLNNTSNQLTSDEKKGRKRTKMS